MCNITAMQQTDKEQYYRPCMSDVCPPVEGAQGEPALVCEKYRAPVADLQILVFFSKCQSSSTVLGSEHRAHYRTSGPQATFMKSVPDCLGRDIHTSGPLECSSVTLLHKFIEVTYERTTCSSRKPGVQKLGQWTDTAHMSIASLSIGCGLYAIPFTQAVFSLIGKTDPSRGGFIPGGDQWTACKGAEHASITVRTNIQVAQSQVEEARKLSMDADKKLAETKVEEIQRMAEYAAFLEDSEVQEAYLRED
ncbi:hypothetical protein L3Q82_004915 [Scortum barcoo]|uniref:Uncharacterized protein n=1 Tax=Scortum barcoo TaxID=214431 RepID=A0ACB8VE84_9TELE|nr:hypothetical protein L3Q82_004915 [Scortum barcoo]